MVTLSIIDSEGLGSTSTANLTVLEQHDVAIVNVTISASKLFVKESANIYVVVLNNGSETETFDVTAFYNDTLIKTQTVTLASGANASLTFLWDTTNVSPGNYQIKAVAATVPGETDIADNTKIGGVVTVRIPDVNGDGKVDIRELAALGRAWGAKTGDANYDIRVDFNEDGVIDGSDLGLLALNWGYGG